jgi:hypothetical protein
MFEGIIKLDGKEVPRTLLGTSPFIAAPQFGHRARLYQLDLYRKPENILNIIRESYLMGVRGIQLIPYPPLIQALEWARDEGIKMIVIGTVKPDTEEDDIKILSELDANAMLLHAMITDKYNWDFIQEKLIQIKDQGILPGLVTHTPYRTTEKLIKSPIIDLFDIYMVPVNRLGYLMDCDSNLADERALFRELMLKVDKTIIAKKVLAAGIMTPHEAFDYLKGLDFVDIVTLGIASEKEAQETFQILKEK